MGLGILLLPVLLVPLPPLLDYPNHLARLWLIASGASAPPLDTFYAIDWSLAVTNIGIDLLALVLGSALGAEAVGRIGIVLGLILPILGTLGLGWAVAGRWHAAMLVVPVLGWNLTFAAGFINYQIAVGAALLTAAAFATSGGTGLRRAVLIGVAGLAIAVVHLFGALFLAALVGAIAVGSRSLPVAAWPAAAWRAICATLPLLVALTALLLAAPATPGHDPRRVGSFFTWEYSALGKILSIVSPFLTYSPVVEAASGLLLLAAFYVGLREGWLRAHFGLGVLAIALVAGSLALPSHFGDTQILDIRLAGMALLTGAAGLWPMREPPARVAIRLAAALLAVGFARSIWTMSRWEIAVRDMAATERAMEPLPRGALLLPVRGEERSPGRPRLAGFGDLHTHYPALAVIQREVFVPGLFSFVGRQPLRVRPEWLRLSVPDGSPPSPAELARAGSPEVLAEYPYLANWRSDFQYLLLIDAERTAPDRLPHGLELMADEGFARLYRIR